METDKAAPTGGLPRWLSGKESTCQTGDSGHTSSILASGRSSGGWNGNPLQYSCLRNPVDRGAWWAIVHGGKKNLTWPSDLSQRRQWHPTPVLLPGRSHGRRSLVGYSPWGHEELDTTERLHFHALEKEMAIHSMVLAWRIPGTGEPGGLPSMGSQSQTWLKRLSSSIYV